MQPKSIEFQVFQILINLFIFHVEGQLFNITTDDSHASKTFMPFNDSLSFSPNKCIVNSDCGIDEECINQYCQCPWGFTQFNDFTDPICESFVCLFNNDCQDANSSTIIFQLTEHLCSCSSAESLADFDKATHHCLFRKKLYQLVWTDNYQLSCMEENDAKCLIRFGSIQQCFNSSLCNCRDVYWYDSQNMKCVQIIQEKNIKFKAYNFYIRFWMFASILLTGWILYCIYYQLPLRKQWQIRRRCCACLDCLASLGFVAQIDTNPRFGDEFECSKSCQTSRCQSLDWPPNYSEALECSSAVELTNLTNTGGQLQASTVVGSSTGESSSQQPILRSSKYSPSPPLYRTLHLKNVS